MTAVVYDAGALIAADRDDRTMWAQHRAWLQRGTVPRVPAPVVAQVSRSPRQAKLRRLLRGCETIPLDELAAHAAGALLAMSGTSDIVDASVVITAQALSAAVLTSDRSDIAALAAASGIRLGIIDV